MGRLYFAREARGGSLLGESRMAIGMRYWGSATVRRGVLVVLSGWLCAGCGAPAEVPDPDVKQNLRSLLEVYQMYTNEKRMAPADEASLRSFVEALPADTKSRVFLPDKLDKLFVSARDGKKFIVKYGIVPDPTVPARLAWEETGQNGKRYVALTMGYVEEYDEASFQSLNK